jgi:hypothetical protein
MANRDHDHDYENDNGGERAVAPASTGGALTSLKALELALGGVDTSSFAGRSGLPLMMFKREGDGTYSFGQKRFIPEAGSRWAANPQTFKRGYICFGNGKKKLGEHLVSVTKPMPDVTKLPDLGFPWQEEWAVNMKCLDGADAGTEVAFTMSTDGGNKSIVGLLDAVKDRLESGQHGGKVAPIVILEKDSYMHTEHGRVWFPVLTIVDWMPLDGPAPAPAAPPPPSPPTPTSSAAEQPRRRRVA